MTRVTTRWRAAIAIAFGVQAAVVAALFGVPALESAHHAQAERAVPTAVAQPQPAPAQPQPVPASSAYPLNFRVTVEDLGWLTTVELPRGSAVPQDVEYVVPGRDYLTTIVVYNPGPVTATNAWFAIAPSSVRYAYVAHAGVSLGSTFQVMSRARWLPPGVTTFKFTVPAADLRPGDFPIIVMGAQEGSRQVTYGIMQLQTPSP
jgi:hypothetical protein